MIKGYKDLKVYQMSYKLALIIHQITIDKFPKHETYEIGAQLRRSVISIPLNIAEGYGKKQSPKEFKRFLNMALGSCNETNVLIDFSHDLGYIDDVTHKKIYEQYDILGKRIYTLIEKWK